MSKRGIVEFIWEQDTMRLMHNVERKKMEMAENVVCSPDGSEWSRDFVSPL